MRIGRNDPCPCGSGKKFKRCCLGKRDEEPPEEPGEEMSPVPLRDRRALERGLADLRRLLDRQNFESVEESQAFLRRELARGGGRLPRQEGRSPAERAQDLMYEAFDAEGPRRLDLARKALELWPDCADAYVLLAEHAEDRERAMELYRKGVEAGERALGRKSFEEDAGHFWGLLETRPYMRAREGLAHCLWASGRRDEAVEHFLDMLRLNPKDNQGVRYSLLACLLEKGDGEGAERLLRQYEGDITASWAYGRALLAFRKEGDSPRARRLLREARKTNPWVPDFLLGKREMPRVPPEYVEFGKESEAVHVVCEQGEAWRQTPGALDWLRAR